MIRAYIGAIGQGKTLSMVRYGLKALKQGRRVITNTPFVYRNFKRKRTIKEWFNGTKIFPVNLYPEYVDTITLLKLLVSESNALFLIDEASVVFSNYGRELLKPEFVMRFAQSRHYNIDIQYTSQGFTHVVTRLMDLTNEVVLVSRPSPQLTINQIYQPEAFLNRKMPPFMRKQFLLDTEFIFAPELKKLYDSYDTLYNITQSATISLDDNFQKTIDMFSSQFDSPPDAFSTTITKPYRILL